MKESKKMARREMLKALSKEMGDMMGEGYKNQLKDKMSVKVASDSPEGLEEGLSKAQEILKKRKELMGEESEMEEKEEKMKEESEESDMKKKIEELEAELQKYKK